MVPGSLCILVYVHLLGWREYTLYLLQNWHVQSSGFQRRLHLRITWTALRKQSLPRRHALEILV